MPQLELRIGSLSRLWERRPGASEWVVSLDGSGEARARVVRVYPRVVYTPCP